jgi:hypothetical protein
MPMHPTLYLSGRSKNGQTQILRVENRTVAQTLTLAELLGFDEKTVLICLWPAEFDARETVEITSSVRLVVWPGRHA